MRSPDRRRRLPGVVATITPRMGVQLYDPLMSAIDIREVERDLRRIPEVRAARIVADSTGSPVEVHIVAVPGKAAKQLARDVQSVAMASQGLEIDHRIVSVVQLDDPASEVRRTPDDHRAAEPLTQPPAPRLILEKVVVHREGLTFTVTVALRADDETVEGTVCATAASAATRRAVAEATLAAIGQRAPEGGRATVEAVDVVLVGRREVAVVVLALIVPPWEEVVVGSAPVRSDGVDQAIARAVLDASNRRLVQLA